MDATRFFTNHFLIAAPGLGDPSFLHAVTLICQHGEDGAMGVTINRASEYRLGDVMAQMEIDGVPPELAGETVLTGGPVQPDRGFVLHAPGGEWESSFLVSPQLAVTTSRDILVAMARGKGPHETIVALGYAGWSAGQLETELTENAWLTVPADPRILFGTPLRDRWLEAARLMGVDMRFMTDYSGHA